MRVFYSFFYQPEEGVDVDWNKGVSQLSFIRIMKSDKATLPCPQPKINGIKPKRALYIADWVERIDYPHSEEYSNLGINKELDRLVNSCEGLYEDDFAGNKYFALQGDKLGGWPYWTQALEYPLDSSGEPMEYLLQLDCGSFYEGPRVKAHAKGLFASDGTGHIFISKKNPSELRFEWATG